MAKQYVIRFKDGKSSSRLTEDQVREKIRKGEVKNSDDISIYPNQFAVHAKDYPEFEELFDDGEKTIVNMGSRKKDALHEDKTNILNTADLNVEDHSLQVQEAGAIEEPLIPVDDFADDGTKKQETTIFERPKEFLTGKEDQGVKVRRKVPKKSFLIILAVFLLLYEEVFEEDDKKKPVEVEMVPVRPQLPMGGAGKVDPERSEVIYGQGVAPYAEDTVQGYRRAVDKFQVALKLDPQNVKALAMLASSYLNLIDSSNKDENTFSVINKLIELSRVKDLDLVQTLVAQVEFLAASNRHDAAIQRLLDYSKVSGKFDPLLYYYLGCLFSEKGDTTKAMGYLNLIPASSLPIPKLYYLRGYLHEVNHEYDDAVAEYKRALAINKNHAKSILGIVRVAGEKGELKTESIRHYMSFLFSNPSYQSPKEYVQTLIFRSKIAQLYQLPSEAISSLESALRIDPRNEELKLEYYTLMHDSGKDPHYLKLAQMYSLVLEGERDFKEGKIHEAISVLIQAKDAFSKSEIPVEKMGDFFYQTGEFQKAQQNYSKALTINPKAANIAIKLIDSLIKNHDWDEAQKYLAKFRNHPKVKSSIDRLAGDLAFHQGNYTLAVQFYRKAMARDTIDTEVYSSYATALREMDQCKDAQFFYSLAQRLDPFSMDAILGSARCLLKTDNLDQAVNRIQSELAKLPKARADLLAGIAEIYYEGQKDENALQFVQQAKDIDIDYPETYRVEGLVYLRQMVQKPDLKKKALEAFKSYSDRKPSDPFGYIQRFEIFIHDSNFEQSAEELNRVFEVSPRYPELHYKRAQLYTKMGRSKDALTELQEELKINPRLAKAMVEEGNIYVRANNLDDAMKAYVKAMEVDPQNAGAKMGAGYVNYLKRQFPSAIALYTSALALDRGNPEIYKKMGYAFRDSGDPQNAAKAFRSYLDLAPDAPDRADFDQYK